MNETCWSQFDKNLKRLATRPAVYQDLNPIPVIVFKCIEILIAILIINKCALCRPFSQALRYDRASYIHATVVQINIKARSYHRTCGEINYPNFHIKLKRMKNSLNKLSNFHIAFSVKQKHCMHMVCISQEKNPFCMHICGIFMR